jgi:hypothetical protein
MKLRYRLLSIPTARCPELNVEKNDDKAKDLVSQFGIYDHKLDLATYKIRTSICWKTMDQTKYRLTPKNWKPTRTKLLKR